MIEQSCVNVAAGAEKPKRARMRRDRGDPNAALAFTIQEFCDAHRICRSTFYNLLEDGKAPRTSKVRGRVLIDREAADEWRRNQRLPDPVL